MDHLREGIGLQGYGQKDPLIAYKKEGFKYFEMMMSQISVDVIKRLMSIQLAPQEAPEDALEQISEEFEEIEHNPSEPNAQIQYNLEADGSLSPVNSASPVKPLQRQQPAFLNQPRQPQPMTLSRGPVGSPLNQPQQPAFTKNAGGLSAVEEVGRNEPCPCGSGKKYKKCHGA
jgi:preprotein translocase subunit SecA